MAITTMATSDPLGALKSTLSTSLGLVPEIGPLLSLSTVLFFPENAGGESALFKALKQEIHNEISKAIDQEHKLLADIAVANSMAVWKDFIKKEFSDKIPSTNQLSFNQIPKGQLGTLYTNLSKAYSDCIQGYDTFDKLPNSYLYISSFINFASFHLSIGASTVKLADFLNDNYPSIHDKVVKDSLHQDLDQSVINTKKVDYSNFLRKAVSQLYSSSSITLDYDGFNWTLKYQPTPTASTQTVGSGGCIGRPTTNKDNYVRLKKGLFYNYVAKVILPVLWHWETGLESTAAIKTDYGMDPDIPYPTVPADYIKGFKPYRFKIAWDTYATETFNLSNPKDHDDFNLKQIYKESVSGTGKFESTFWLRWGKPNESIPEFNIRADKRYQFPDLDSRDFNVYENLSPGSITFPLFDTNYRNGNNIKGVYPRTVNKGSGHVPLTVSLGQVATIMNDYYYRLDSFLPRLYFYTKFQMPLKGKPAAKNLVGQGRVHSGNTSGQFSKIYQFTNIPTNNPWGAKIFEKPEDSLQLAWCDPVNWYYGTGASTSTPFQAEYARFDADFRFPKALKFSVVLYQVDLSNNLITYFPVGDSSKADVSNQLNPKLPLYVAVNDNNYKDNSGSISLNIGISPGLPVPLPIK